jgi:cancer susceptibility candidate protein 1
VELLEDEIDMRRYCPAGGPIVMEIFELPAPPKTVGQWTIRKVTPDCPQTFVYPQELTRAPQTTTTDSDQSIEGGVVTTPPAVVPGSAQWPPIEITMSLPTSFHFCTEPQLAQWDKELNTWRTKGVKDVTFDMEDSSVTFQTYHFSPLAIMVDQYSNMPYQSWQVVPKGLNHTLLKLGGAAIEVTIEIKDSQCILLEPSEEPSLSHLLDQPLTGRQLLSALKKSGVNFDPEPDGSKYCSVPDKNSELEVSVYRHIAMAAAAFQFSWSHWNRESGRNRYILQCAEVKGGNEPARSGVYMCGESNWRLGVREDSEQFSCDIAEGSEVHGDLYSTLLADSTTKNLPSSSPSHTDTLHYWLSHSRPLSYSS